MTSRLPYIRAGQPRSGLPLNLNVRPQNTSANRRPQETPPMNCKRPLLLCLAIVASTNSFSQGQPLPDFERIVNKCKQSFSQVYEDIWQASNSSAWIKRVTWPGSVKYDVKRTDSLVSPYIAHIEIESVVVGARAGSEAEAQALPVSQDGPLARRTTRIEFAYQDGKWLAQSGTEQTAMRIAAGKAFETPLSFKLSKEELARPTTAAQRCLGVAK